VELNIGFSTFVFDFCCCKWQILKHQTNSMWSLMSKTHCFYLRFSSSMSNLQWCALSLSPKKSTPLIVKGKLMLPNQRTSCSRERFALFSLFTCLPLSFWNF
jgi:hypothetical protein